METKGTNAHPFKLFQDARMQVLVHVSVLECVEGGFLGRGYRGIEVLELGGEAHADFEGVGHVRRVVPGWERDTNAR
jgi:hypothetical protein